MVYGFYCTGHAALHWFRSAAPTHLSEHPARPRVHRSPSVSRHRSSALAGARHGTARHGTARHGTARHGAARRGTGGGRGNSTAIGAARPALAAGAAHKSSHWLDLRQRRTELAHIYVHNIKVLSYNHRTVCETKPRGRRLQAPFVVARRLVTWGDGAWGGLGRRGRSPPALLQGGGRGGHTDTGPAADRSDTAVLSRQARSSAHPSDFRRRRQRGPSAESQTAVAL